MHKHSQGFLHQKCSLAYEGTRSKLQSHGLSAQDAQGSIISGSPSYLEAPDMGITGDGRPFIRSETCTLLIQF